MHKDWNRFDWLFANLSQVLKQIVFCLFWVAIVTWDWVLLLVFDCNLVTFPSYNESNILTTHQIWGVEEGVTMWSTCRTLYRSSPVAVGLIRLRMVTSMGHGYLPCWGDDPTLHRWLWSLSLGPAGVSVSWSGLVSPPSRDVLKICRHRIKQNIYILDIWYKNLRVTHTHSDTHTHTNAERKKVKKTICIQNQLNHWWRVMLKNLPNLPF